MSKTIPALLTLSFLILASPGALHAKPVSHPPGKHRPVPKHSLPKRQDICRTKAHSHGKRCSHPDHQRRLSKLTATPTRVLTAKEIRENGHTTLCGALTQIASAVVFGCQPF